MCPLQPLLLVSDRYRRTIPPRLCSSSSLDLIMTTNHEQLEGYERYRQFMDRLTESNVDDHIDLPMIAVMGDTSSGKSSLLSSISLVDLPSADCLTTRCPIMLKMHHATSRSASVKVSWKNKVVGGAVFVERKIGENNWSDITMLKPTSLKYLGRRYRATLLVSMCMVHNVKILH